MRVGKYRAHGLQQPPLHQGLAPDGGLLMGMYGFQKRFVPKIKSGEKTHTIRAFRKCPDKPGNTLHLYYAPRTKYCELIGRFLCTKVMPITIAAADWYTEYVNGDHIILAHPAIYIEDIPLSNDEMEHLAIRDGFGSLRDMASFWDLSQPLNGQIVHWRFE